MVYEQRNGFAPLFRPTRPLAKEEGPVMLLGASDLSRRNAMKTEACRVRVAFYAAVVNHSAYAQCHCRVNFLQPLR